MRHTTHTHFHIKRDLRILLAGLVCSAAALSQAQTIEDHSLPKSAIKTWHVKCSNGRLGMVRYDTRFENTKMCVSVQDGSRLQSCTMATQQQAASHVKMLANWVCQ